VLQTNLNFLLFFQCSSVYRSNGAAYFSACVLDNFFAYGPYNDSTTSKRRRRATGQNGTMIAGRARVFFSTTCSSKNDRLKYANSSSSLSKCAASRLAICNAVFNSTSTTTLRQWTPLPDPFSLSAVDMISNNYVVLTILNLFAYPTNIALAIANSFGFSQNALSSINAGCEYIGPISQSDIAAAVAAQSTETTTLPGTTVMAAG
jgi:hypothetical protein